MALVLVVDDEPRMVELIGLALESQGIAWLGAGSAVAAMDVLLNQAVDLVVLDIMLPGESGLELCRRIRTMSSLPIVLVTALGDTEQRIAGLEAGADDYIAKPFSPRELGLRISAVLRRERAIALPPSELVRTVGDLVLDAKQLSVAVAGERVRLSASEFRLLWRLSDEVDHTVGWRDLYRAIADGQVPFGAQEVVRTAIYRLRGKLGDNDRPLGYLQTDRGRGYRLSAPRG